LDVLRLLVTLLLLRLLLRRTWAAIAVTIVASRLLSFAAGVSVVALPVVITGIIGFAVGVLVLMRFGLLTAVAASFVALVMGQTVGSLDLSSWYADRAL